MKVTSRELTLLIVLGSVFLIYVLYTFLFNPLIGDLLISRDSLETARQQKLTVEQHSETIPELIRQQENLAQEAEVKVEAYFPDLNEDILASFFHRTTANGGSPIQNISFNSLEIMNLDTLIPPALTVLEYPYGEYVATFNQDLSNDDYQHPAPGDSAPAKSVLLRRVSVGFGTTTYEQAIQQLRLVENLERTTMVETFVLSREEGGLTGNVVYGFFGVDKIADEDPGLPTTNLTEGNGKTNPF